MQNDTYLPISEAAKRLGVSVDTLRRWDKKGIFSALKTPGGHRMYSLEQIHLKTRDLFLLAKNWVTTQAVLLPNDVYCENNSVFQARLARMEQDLVKSFPDLDWISLIVSATGEIGNNSFDHNLANLGDIPGIFFAYDTSKKQVVLADRGQGVFKTLQRVKPTLVTDEDALRTAFTEVLSGRAPEARGNGLKLVRTITERYPLEVDFYSGTAHTRLRQRHPLQIEKSKFTVPGSLTLIQF